MEDDRQKKLEVGREKLAAFKKKKQKQQSPKSTSTSQSDSSFSSSPPLPDNVKRQTTDEVLSDSSIISEHLNSNSGSVENDRSFQEIEISHILSNFSHNLSTDDPTDHISQEAKPSPISLLSSNDDSCNVIGKSHIESSRHNVHSILSEILRSDQFRSDSEHTLQQSDVDSNENSFNLFKDINLNDSIIHDYGVKSVEEQQIDKNSLNFSSLNLPLSSKKDESLKLKHLEEIVNAKENTIVALSAELESLKEMTFSNQSTPSLNTSTTDYKLYHDEFQNKIVEYQNALTQRDNIIQQLTEALQQSVVSRKELQEQSDFFSTEITVLQKQLSETSTLLRQRKREIVDIEAKQDSLKSIKDSSIQTDSLPSQVLQHDIKTENGNNFVINESALTETQSSILASYSLMDDDKTPLNLDKECLLLEETLTLPQIQLMKEIKDSVTVCVESKLGEYRTAFQNELRKLEDKLQTERNGYEAKIAQLQQLMDDIQNNPNDIIILRGELEARHAKEMEELRTYFEQKCADVEKHYSEEVFSEQRRKMSESSLCSESSDILFHAGPGGDTGLNVEMQKKLFQEFTKQDFVKLQSDLSNIMSNLNKYDLEKINQEDHRLLLAELKNHNFQSVFKFDLFCFKLEMQNKFHAELEILREDYENRIDVLNVDHKNLILSLEKKYLDQIDSLKFELDEALRNAEVHVNTAVQEVASSGEFELAEVVQSYERRLQEQVTLAKIDIINALELQIQMLVASTVEDAEWPTELLQIRNRFTEKYEKQIADLEKNHQDEITRLKDEHYKTLNATLERARRKSLKDASFTENESEIIEERDNLRKTTVLLRHLIGQLMKYFSQCEDEVNKTIVDELLKQSLGKNLTELEMELNLDEESNNSNLSSLRSVGKKRVHFKPNFEDIISTIEDTDANLSLELRNELETCLERLKSDANAILNLSLNFSKSEIKTESENEIRIASLTRQLVSEGKLKRDLAVELEEAKNFVQSLEIERSNLESQVEQLINKQKVLEDDLNKARGKITELIENGQKELTSKGYGEDLQTEYHSLSERIAILGELQERARTMVVECASNANHPLLELVEELCREGTRVTEEAKNEHEDLRMQIEAADKKLRATCRFLEEQAADREQERDEAQKEIACLREQIRNRDKDRISCEQINKEKEDVDSHLGNACCRSFKNLVVRNVEHLESQMREMSKVIDENELKKIEIETEKKEAIEKIFVLRDIIRDLEAQVETKTETESELRNVIVQLQDVIKHQNKANEELNQYLGSTKNLQEAKNYQQHVEQLEDEIQRLKLNSEFAGSEGEVKQLKVQLSEFEATVDERTRELEGLLFAVSTTNCSSPSEDMSVRDQIRPRSPSVLDECDLPLQQLARLKEKLIKHSRAEDAAIKRIHDLEMEIDTIKRDLNEVQNERDLLQDQVSDHLILISSLQMRLDDQRLHAEQVQKQTNTSLEVRIYDLETEIKNLLDVIAAREKSIKHLNKTIEETKRKLSDQEVQLTSKLEDTVILELNEKIKKLENENCALLLKINNDAQNAQVLPSLVDNILADKNKDINKLQEKLDKVQAQLNEYSSLNLDREQLKVLSQLSNSERAFSDILCLLEQDSPDTLRKIEKPHESLTTSMHVQPHKRNPNDTAFLSCEAELSSIEKLDKSNLHYSVQAPLTKPNSTEIQKSNDKRVHFEDTVFNATIVKLQEELLELKNEVFTRDELIKEYSERLEVLANLEANVKKLQAKLELTEKSLQDATATFEKELTDVKESEKNLRIDVAEKKMHLTKKEEEIRLLKEDSARKDQMHIDLVKEKRDLEKSLNNLQLELQKYKECEILINDNNKEIFNLKAQIASMNSNDSIKILEEQLQERHAELKELREEYTVKVIDLETKLVAHEKELLEKDRANVKLQKDFDNKEAQLLSLSSEINELKKIIDSKNIDIEALQQHAKKEKEKVLADFEMNVKELKNLLIDRETEIEILNEDAQRYQDDLAQLETQIKSLKSVSKQDYELKVAQKERDVASKDLEILKLTTEIDDLNRKTQYLEELITEKDKIVSQMSADSSSLRINLQTIQNKMQESGNVVDLKRRLDEEKQLNESLKEQVNIMKLERGDNKIVDMTASIEDITGAVCKQLDYSAELDSNILSALEISEREENSDVQQLKDVLIIERNVNAELKSLNNDLRCKLKELEERCFYAEEHVRRLEIQLENEKRMCHKIQLDDANMLEQLGLRLEAALENEVEYQKSLEIEKQSNSNLEKQINALKQKLTNLSSGENSKTEVTEYKSLPTLESLELNRLRSDLLGLESEVKKLQSNIKDLKTDKLKSNATLKYTKDMLEFKNSEIGKLEARIERLMDAEKEIKEKWLSSKAEVEQKNRELENSRILIEDLEQEQHQMKDQIENVNEKLSKALEREQETLKAGQLNQAVPDHILDKIKELSGSVQKQNKENHQLTKIIENLNKERVKWQNRIAELEELNHIKFPFTDPIVRANHLFAKYLRSESYRKALTWQKKYITSLLASYQNYSSPISDVHFAANTQKLRGKYRFRAAASCIVAIVRMQFLVQRWRSGIREVTGTRNHRLAKHTHLPLSAPNYTPYPTSTHFQVGQPVSSQNFPIPLVPPIDPNLNRSPTPSTSRQNSPATSSTSPDLYAWSGQTPPSKDYSGRQRERILTKH